jgi:hypothetical protein
MFEDLEKREVEYKLPEFTEEDIRRCNVLVFQELSCDLLKIVSLWKEKYNLSYHDVFMSLEAVLAKLVTNKYNKQKSKIIEVNRNLLGLKTYKY